MAKREIDTEPFKHFALDIVVQCFRNTYLEDLHAGISPSSKTGDYSDVKVVTPYGEIPWTQVSRFGDDEMKKLMIEAVDKVYTFMLASINKSWQPSCEQWVIMTRPNDWNEPQVLKEWVEEEFIKKLK